MKKGFTLIELLAVIVILAAIALIVTPLVLGAINTSKEETYKRSIDMYARAIKTAASLYDLSDESGESLTVEKLKSLNLIKYEGSKVECETEIINEDGSVYLSNCKVDGKLINYTYGKTDEEIETPEEEPVNLIDFKIDDVDYQAADGMTWESWINSKYNVSKKNGTFTFEEYIASGRYSSFASSASQVRSRFPNAKYVITNAFFIQSSDNRVVVCADSFFDSNDSYIGKLSSYPGYGTNEYSDYFLADRSSNFQYSNNIIASGENYHIYYDD